jgi:hypothetical protein
MPRLRILASGESTQAQAQARGKLFEQLIAEVLRHNGYTIDNYSPSVNYAGMEIDINGYATVTRIPLYAECKCYETAVDAPKLQAFFGKYMAKWLEDNRCHGLFVALPGINSHADGFYRTYCASSRNVTVRLLSENDVLSAIFATNLVALPGEIIEAIRPEQGTAGDQLLLYTDKGYFWVQYIVPPGGGIATRIAVLDPRAKLITDNTTIDCLVSLWPELGHFELAAGITDPVLVTTDAQRDVEQIVEVRGSSSCFEYQFPASPEHFIGREAVLKEVQSFAQSILDERTSARGLLFEANSGWGKSSLVLSVVARLSDVGHYALAVDSRSASSSQFVLRIVDHLLGKYEGLLDDRSDPVLSREITGFDGCVQALVQIGHRLKAARKLLLVFLDQFENVFFIPDALRRIRDLVLRLCDAQTNVVIGFSWKTDLIGLTSEFPYQLRDTISGCSKRITLETFSDVESNALLDRLRLELKAPLRKDLRFFLLEFSQGYPWLLKKLCAHVKTQRESGVLQSNIASNLLNVEQLFQEDLYGLSSDEEDALRRIAKVAPISIAELGDEFRTDVVQNLVHRRLLVRIGNKYDVYWDIFRDYLNAGRVPVQENYILRMQVGSVINAARLLAEAGGVLSTTELRGRAGLTEKSYFNVARDLRLLGLATSRDGCVALELNLPADRKEFQETLLAHVRDRLPLNRLVWRLREALATHGHLSLESMAEVLEGCCPYVSAASATWRQYARVLASWMDLADLTIFNGRSGVLFAYRPGTQVRQRDFQTPRRGSGVAIPRIQYKPVEQAAIRIAEAFLEHRAVDWMGFRRSTVSKAVMTLSDLGFMQVETHSARVGSSLVRIASVPERIPEHFGQAAMGLPAFAGFVQLLQEYQRTGCSLAQLGVRLREKLGLDWKDGTAETNAKIMLDWARHTGRAPGAFAARRRVPRSSSKQRIETQISLFEDLSP